MLTLLLVHGAWHSGRCWDRVVPLLESLGHRVFAPSLTGYGDRARLLGPEVGLDTHVEDVLELIERENLTDVVLVGHSYAGLVFSAVANRVPRRIAHLVYLDAMVPQDGETAVDVQPVTQHLIDQAASNGDGWRIPPMPEQPPPFGLFGVTDPGDVAGLRTMVSDHPVRCLVQPVRLDNPDLTRFYVRTSTAWAPNRRASRGARCLPSSPAVSHRGCGNCRPVTTAWSPCPPSSPSSCSRSPVSYGFG